MILNNIILYYIVSYNKLSCAICQILYNYLMNLRAQINYWLSLNQSTYEKLAAEMTKIMNKKYTRGSLNAKLSRGTLTFHEFETIARIFNCNIKIEEI